MFIKVPQSEPRLIDTRVREAEKKKVICLMTGPLRGGGGNTEKKITFFGARKIKILRKNIFFGARKIKILRKKNLF